MIPGRMNIVLDGQWGSTGKGKLAAWLAEEYAVELAVCDFQTNAGHTVVMDDGTKHVLQQLPVAAAVRRDCVLAINAGASLTLGKLFEEIDAFDAADRLIIHPHAVIVTDSCREFEAQNLNRISSTLKGCGAALGMKAMRHPSVVLAKDVPELRKWVRDTTPVILDFLASGKMVMGEGAQGFDLSLNHGHEYPYVTSRDVSTASFLSNACLPPQMLGHVYGCVRTFPIRVGNAFDAAGEQIGHSGPWYKDQEELSWEDVTRISDSKVDLLERTTVTQKVRRVFTFSFQQYEKFVRACAPTHIFLNFVNYIDARATGVREWKSLPAEVHTFVRELRTSGARAVNAFTNLPIPEVKFLGTGPKMSDMVEV